MNIDYSEKLFFNVAYEFPIDETPIYDGFGKYEDLFLRFHRMIQILESNHLNYALEILKDRYVPDDSEFINTDDEKLEINLLKRLNSISNLHPELDLHSKKLKSLQSIILHYISLSEGSSRRIDIEYVIKLRLMLREILLSGLTIVLCLDLIDPENEDGGYTYFIGDHSTNEELRWDIYQNAVENKWKVVPQIFITGDRDWNKFALNHLVEFDESSKTWMRRFHLGES